MLKWIELGGAAVYPFEPAHLGDIVRWMRRYSEAGKREMDLADASPTETGVTEILSRKEALAGVGLELKSLFTYSQIVDAQNALP